MVKIIHIMDGGSDTQEGHLPHWELFRNRGHCLPDSDFWAPLTCYIAELTRISGISPCAIGYLLFQSLWLRFPHWNQTYIYVKHNDNSLDFEQRSIVDSVYSQETLVASHSKQFPRKADIHFFHSWMDMALFALLKNIITKTVKNCSNNRTQNLLYWSFWLLLRLFLKP